MALGDLRELGKVAPLCDRCNKINRAARIGSSAAITRESSSHRSELL